MHTHAVRNQARWPLETHLDHYSLVELCITRYVQGVAQQMRSECAAILLQPAETAKQKQLWKLGGQAKEEEPTQPMIDRPTSPLPSMIVLM